jgi:D-threo-aldose 1-dehydrogenase
MDAFHGRGSGSGFVGGQPHRAVVDYSYDGTMRSVEQSLLRLGTDRIDLLLIHDVDVWTHGADAIEDRFREAMAGAYPALDRLRSEKVVAGIGIGVNEADMCVRFAEAGSFDVMLLAGRYSLLEQPALEHFLPARWGLHTRAWGGTRHLANDHPRWPLHRAELLDLDDSLLAAAGLPGLDTPPDSVL